MISTVQATFLACLLFLFIGVIGIAIGFIASLITRRPRGIRGAAADGSTAFLIAAIYAFIGGEILAARGSDYDLVESTILVGASSVIVKHIVQAAFRSRRGA